MSVIIKAKKHCYIKISSVCFVSERRCVVYYILKYARWCRSYGAFPLRGTTRFGTACYGTARLGLCRFAFPLQFSDALEWAGLFTCRYSCAASTAGTSS